LTGSHTAQQQRSRQQLSAAAQPVMWGALQMQQQLRVCCHMLRQVQRHCRQRRQQQLGVLVALLQVQEVQQQQQQEAAVCLAPWVPLRLPTALCRLLHASRDYTWWVGGACKSWFDDNNQ
jgi:hypothetical protein